MAILTGDGALSTGVIAYQPALKGLVPRGVNTIQVFALPETNAKGKTK